MHLRNQLIMLEDFFDVCHLENISEGIRYLESRQNHFTKDISSSKGHGLILLRICNELIRRLPKSSESMLGGQILLLLSHLFPSGERSGVNLRGDFNLDNTTAIDDSSLQDSEYSLNSLTEQLNSSAKDLSFGFYRDFWKLQFYFLHPSQAILEENWSKVSKVEFVILLLMY